MQSRTTIIEFISSEKKISGEERLVKKKIANNKTEEINIEENRSKKKTRRIHISWVYIYINRKVVKAMDLSTAKYIMDYIYFNRANDSAFQYHKKVSIANNFFGLIRRNGILFLYRTFVLIVPMRSLSQNSNIYVV